MEAGIYITDKNIDSLFHGNDKMEKLDSRIHGNDRMEVLDSPFSLLLEG